MSGPLGGMKKGTNPPLNEGEGVLRLSDGRALGYTQYGDTSAWPIILFQGTPTSRLPHNPLDTSVPVRLLVAERPGFGCSDFSPGRTLLDWPGDVRELVDYLGIERFSVVGVSGGAPHALACGVRLAHRIARLGVVSGVGPIEASGATSGMAAQRKVGAWIARPCALSPSAAPLGGSQSRPESRALRRALLRGLFGCGPRTARESGDSLAPGAQLR